MLMLSMSQALPCAEYVPYGAGSENMVWNDPALELRILAPTDGVIGMRLQGPLADLGNINAKESIRTSCAPSLRRR